MSMKLLLTMALVMLSACSSSHARRASVDGVLEMVGGPFPGTSIPVPGEVTLSAQDGKHYTVRAHSNGSFHLSVKPGTYTATATSPNYNGGVGRCAAESALDLTDTKVGHKTVVACQMK